MKSAPTSNLLLAALAVATLSPVAAVAMERLPYSQKVPVNVANESIPGTQLQSSEGISAAKALISSDAAEAAILSDGKAEAVIALVGTHAINEVYFSNDGAQGKVFISTSADGKKWLDVAQSTFADGDRTVSVRFANAQARFVKTAFEVAKGGGIRSFGIYGATSDRDYKLRPTSQGDSTVNLAGGVGGARPIYAYPSPVNTDATEIKKNIFRFPQTTDAYRIVVYDLGTPRLIKQLATAYSEQPTRVEVYTFTQLPEKHDWRGKMTLDPSVFDQLTPAVVEADARGTGHITLKPQDPVTAQYVVFRFEPNYNRRAGQASLAVPSWTRDTVMALVPSARLLGNLSWLSGSHQVALTPGPAAPPAPSPVSDNSFGVTGVNIGGAAVGGGGLEVHPVAATTKATLESTPAAVSAPASPSNNFIADHAAAGVGNTNPFAVPAVKQAAVKQAAVTPATVTTPTATPASTPVATPATKGSGPPAPPPPPPPTPPPLPPGTCPT